MAVLPLSNCALVYGMSIVVAFADISSPVYPTNERLAEIYDIQDFETIWRSAFKSEPPGGNEEAGVCSIVDLQHAVNNFLQESDELSSSAT